MARVLYLTRNGLAEPLGQSQVLAYLRGLSRDHTITLVTCEKPEDAADAPRMAALREDCEAHGIDWHPQAFRPGRLGAALGISQTDRLAARLVAERGIELVHARSYLPAITARRLKRGAGIPYIFDMRALWPEEMIAAGRLKRGGLVHRVLTRVERLCLKDAGVVVSLTHAAAAHLRATYPAEMAGDRVAIIPTCADLDRFRLAPVPEGPEVWSCIGTVASGWFRLGWLDALFAEAARRDPEARFEVVTRDDPGAVRAGLPGVPEARLTVGPATPAEMPGRLAGHHVSAFFYAGQGASDLGRAPTRLAEILGTGRPVVANEGVGDVAEILRDHRVGVLMAEGGEAAALDALAVLRADPELPARARATAEKLFSLDGGVRDYGVLYDRLVPRCA